MSLKKELSNIDASSTSTYSSSSASNKVKFYMIERLGRISDEEDNKKLFIADVEDDYNVDEDFKSNHKPLMTSRSIQANFLNSPTSTGSVTSRTNSFNYYKKK